MILRFAQNDIIFSGRSREKFPQIPQPRRLSVVKLSAERNASDEHAESKDLGDGENRMFRVNRNQYTESDGPMEYNGDLSDKNTVVC
jgi:hypothetical protein